MINGNSLVVQMATEDTYGAVPSAMTKKVNVSSEGFKWEPTKKDEGLLTGGRTTGKVETMSIKTSGSISTLARPDDVGLFIKNTLGIEETPALVDGTEGAYLHTFKAIGTAETDSLPSLTFTLDKKAAVLVYNGCKIDSLSFSADPEDYLKIDLSIVGKEETTGALTNSLSLSPLKAFKFRHGQVKLNNSVLADITSIKLDYKNNLDQSIQTTATGKYYKEPECGSREVTADLEMLYSTESETLRNTWYKTDDAVSLELDFTSDEEIEDGVPYQLRLTLPNVQVNTMENPSFSGTDTIKQSVNFKAIEVGADELIVVEVVNGLASAY